MQEAFQKLLDQTVLFFPRILTGVVIFLAFWLLSLLLQKIVLRFNQRHAFHQNVQVFIAKMIKFATLLFGLTTALGTMGINISALVAGLGLTSFVLGLAFKDLLSNALAGVLILISKPFEHGDRISILGLEGTIIQINLRYVMLKTEEREILIPNSSFLTNPLTIQNKKAEG